MEIKLAGLFKVVDACGPEMNRGETVSLFNDMCFMEPGSLISLTIAPWFAESPFNSTPVHDH